MYIILYRSTLCGKFVLVFVRASVCVVLDCLPDFGTDIRYKQRLYPS